MTRAVLAVGMLGAALGVFALARPAPQPGHRLLHVGCPPGSHPTTADKTSVARKLKDARARTLADRSLTARHPR